MKEQRISLLSLRQVWEKPGIFVFSALVIAYNILVAYHEVRKGNGFTETLIAIVGYVTNFIPYGFFWTMVGFEVGGWLMIKYRMFMDERAKRIAKAKAEGIAEGEAKGKAEGIAEGEAKGIAERDRVWTAWNNRRLDAAAKGHPFDEPPPGNNLPAPPQ